MPVRSFEHIGLIVQDLEKVAAFFDLLGFERGETATVGGEWADRVNGLTGTEVEMVFLTAPDGSGAIELSRFISPSNTEAPASLPSNALGLRHLAYRVDGVEELVARLRAAGYDLVRELVNYEDVWLVGYVRGPEGLLIELGERLDA
ncbi:VOC family protein [Microbacterium sp. AZCO]|uniref:VOC family protein n=1 Tax=Microbacterium sp. AZCO TaxID=3142976 RepID=UPI0031F33ECF